MSKAKDELNVGDNEFSSGNGTATGLLSILTSLFVIFINALLAKIIRVLSAYEQHETYSKYNVSVAVKLTIATFINTAIIPMFVNIGKHKWFTRGGLMEDIFYNTFFVAIVSPLLYLFDFGNIVRKIRMCREERLGDKSKMTQRQANKLFEGPPLDMAQRYADTMLLFSIVLFYAFPLPILSLLGVIGSCLQYYVEKWALLKRHKYPEQMGATMADVFSRMIPFFCLLYSLSMLVFMSELSGEINIFCLVFFFLILSYILIPITYI